MDEVIIIDVTRGGDPDFLSAARAIADEAFVPVTLGGGIRTLDDVKRYFDAGADKVAVNTGIINKPHLIGDIATKWGVQSLVASVDGKDGMVVSDCGTKTTGMAIQEWCRKAVLLGTGEILLQPVEKDGSLMGYDLELLQQISGSVSVPVIINGGAGNWQHMAEGFAAGADACATQCIYHFTPTGIRGIKQKLLEAGINVRPHSTLQTKASFPEELQSGSLA